MNILIFSTFHLPPHFLGLNLEYLQRNIDAGNEVYLVDCQKSFDKCGFNTYGLKYMCEICVFRENKGLKLLNGKIKRVALEEIITDGDRDKAENFISNIPEISQRDSYNSFEVGEAVFSPYISKTRDRNFTSTADQKILKDLAHNAIVSYESISRFIDEKNISKLYLFNGRWDLYRAALAAARLKNIDVDIFEKYRKGGFYEEFGNNLPHNINNKFSLINSTWNNSEVSLGDRIEIANKFFEQKRNGDAILDKSYTNDQVKGKLPDSYNKNLKTFVLFNSSDDEFAAVGKEYKNPFFEDQLDGILYLVNFFKQREDFQLIIRMHPNLKGLDKDYLDPLFALEDKYANVILIRPEDPTDSYKLMDIADTVISFGSTAGLEASYWQKPVLLLGKCAYYYADVAYVPDSKEEISLLLESDLVPKNKINSQKFAYYFSQGGVKAQYYYDNHEGQVFFREKNLEDLPGWFEVYYKSLKFLKIQN